MSANHPSPIDLLHPTATHPAPDRPELQSYWGFRRFARLTITVAGQLYGDAGAEQQAVHDAWSEVGIDIPVLARAKARNR